METAFAACGSLARTIRHQATSRLRGLGVAFLATLIARPALAHFPFLIPSEDGSTVRLVMSETMAEDGRMQLRLLSGAQFRVEVAGQPDAPLASPTADESRASMTIAVPGSGTRTVAGVADLGIMARDGAAPHRLVYYPKAVIGNPMDGSTALGSDAPIEFIATVGHHAYHLTLLVDGKPLANSPMHLIYPDGRDEEVTTDDQGRSPPLMPGQVAAWARHWIDSPGEVDGKSYSQVRRYATYVAHLPDPHSMMGLPAVAQPASPQEALQQRNAPLHAPLAVSVLPRRLSSFGATILDGWLYVYGGHSGQRHEYSTASVSGRFSRAPIADLARGSDQWEELPGGPAVQGLNLVSHNGKVIRAGGMEPRNAPGTLADNHSLDEVASYDPTTRRWSQLPPLPEPRSSHDMAVVGDTLVVIGGWNLAGSRGKTSWPETALLLDLTDRAAGWEAIPQPFTRRALIVAVRDESIFVIGGFDDQDRAQVDVDVLHLPTRKWSKGPSLPVRARSGFAPAAAVVDGTIYASVATGEVFALAEGAQEWAPIAQAAPRIVHRMVPDLAPEGAGLLILGGAREAEMTDLIERVTLHGAGAAPATPAHAHAQAAAVPASTRPAKGWAHPDPAALEHSMGRIDAAMDALTSAQAAHWPDSAGGAIEELLNGLDAVPARKVDAPEAFVALLATSVDAAERLREAFEASAAGPDRRSVELDPALALVKASCKECHAQFR